MIVVYQRKQSYMDRLQAIVHAYKKINAPNNQIIKLKLNIETKNTTNSMIL